MKDLNSRKESYKKNGGPKPEEVFVVPHLVQGIGDGYDHDYYKDTYGIFEDNHTIKKVIIPPNVTKIPAWTFKGCVNLEEIEFPCEEENGEAAGVYIGDEAFRDCVKLKKLVFHRSISLGVRAFFNCSSLRTVTYGEGRNSCRFATEAFGNCTALREVTLPYCRYGSMRVFDGCTSLEIIRLANKKHFKDLKHSTSKRGLKDYKKNKWKGNCPAKVQWGFKKAEAICLFSPSDGQSDTIDDNYAFKPVYGGEEVVVIAPGTVSLDRPKENPNHGLFEGNQTIKKVVLPASLVSIAPRTFFGCTNLEVIEFDPYRKKFELDIGAEAFRGCSGLKEVTLPGLVKVHTQAFAECKSLQRITFESVPKENMPRTIIKWLHDKKMRLEITSYVHIGKRAFSECESLNEVNFKSNIFEIKDYAFENCKSLKTIELSYVHNLGEGLFSGCTSLETIYRAQKLKRLKYLKYDYIKKYLRSERRYKRGCSAKVKRCKTKVEIPIN